MTKVFTVGVFDFFHLGHLRLFERARKYGDFLTVAVQRNVKKYSNGEKTIYSLRQRIEFVKSIKYVDKVVIYDNVDEIIKKVDFDIFLRGEDQWHDGFKRAIEYCRCNNKKIFVVPRTKGISSTKLKEIIYSNF